MIAISMFLFDFGKSLSLDGFYDSLGAFDCLHPRIPRVDRSLGSIQLAPTTLIATQTQKVSSGTSSIHDFLCGAISNHTINIPELDRATAQWTDDYVARAFRVLARTSQGPAQESLHNYSPFIWPSCAADAQQRLGFPHRDHQHTAYKDAVRLPATILLAVRRVVKRTVST